MFDISKVDSAIEKIADEICKNDTVNGIEEMRINAEMTTALAELINARAVLEKEEYKC